MRKLLEISTFLLLLAMSCKEEKSCTEEFRTYSVTISNFDGSPATFDNIFLLRNSSNDTLAVEPGVNGEPGRYSLIDDNLNINSPEVFILQGFRGSQIVLSEKYEFTHDECHVVKLSGPSEITLD